MKTPEDRMEDMLTKMKAMMDLAMVKMARNKLNILSTREAVIATGFSRQMLYILRKSGKLRYSRVGGRIFYEAAEFERLIREHRVPLKLNKATRQKTKAKRSR